MSAENPTSKMSLLEKLEGLDEKKAKASLIRIYNSYLNPAFGALPKRENEIIMFQELQKLGVFDANPDLYSMVSSLRVTRSKARNLIYESNLRKESNLEEELIEILKDPILFKIGDKVCLEIDNPLLIDHLKYVLKGLGHITDSSFSPELVKLTPEAYKALLNKKFQKVSKKELHQALIACGAEKEVSVKTVLTGVLKKVGKKVADDAGDKLGEEIGDYLGDLFSGGLDKAKEYLTNELGENKEVKI